MEHFNLEYEFNSALREIFITPHCSCCDKSDCIKRNADSFFDSVPEGSSIAVYGVGCAASALLLLLEPRNAQKIKYYSDRRASENTFRFDNQRVLAPDELLNINPDVVLLSSKIYAEDMKEYLLETGFDGTKIIAPPLDYAEKDFTFYNIPCRNNLICQANSAIHGSNYQYLFETLDGYLNSEYCADIELREMLLANLIFAYLGIRDIVNANKYIKLYAEYRYSCYELFERLSSKLEQLLAMAKEKIAQRKQDAILIYLLDGFNEKMAEQTTYIKSFLENAHNFKRAFTQYAFTTSTLQVMFTGKDLVDEGGCEVTSFDAENSPLIDAIVTSGYKLECFLKWRADLFNTQNNAASVIMSETMSVGLWQMITRLAMNDCKSVFYAHFMESHTPFENGFINCQNPIDLYQFFYKTKWINQLASEQKSVKYIDEQLEFFDSLVPKTVTKLIMSDHGRALEEYLTAFGEAYSDPYALACEKCRILLSVQSQYMEKGESNDIFTIKDFKELFRLLIGKKTATGLFTEYSKVQVLPYYREDMIKRFYPKLPLPVRGVITSEGCYLVAYDGVEAYYPDNSGEDRIDEPLYASEIEKARQLCGSDFHGLFDMPRFSVAKKYYLQAGLIKE